MANPWFRMYAEFLVDQKVQMLNEADQRRYIMLLCMRCSNGDVTLHDEEVAFQLRISNEEWARTKAVLVAKKLVTEANKPTAWDKRQYTSDSSAVRVARHREKKKQGSNVDVTLQKRPQKQIQITDTEKEKSTERAREPDGTIEQQPQKAKPPTRHGEVAIRLREQNVRIQPADPYLCDWVEAGVTDQELDQSVAKARRTKGDTEPIAAAYLNPIVRETIAARGKPRDSPMKSRQPPESTRPKLKLLGEGA